MIREIYEVSKTGRLDGLRCKEDELALVGTDEVQVKVRGIGLNFADIFAIYGLYSATPPTPFIPGLEFSGEVISIGSSVKNFQIGDRVMGVSRFGGYATHLNQKESYLFPLPKNWSFAEGAAFAVQGLTAYYALVPLGNCKPGDLILIHSAAGGVGILANRIAKKLGAVTIGSIGSKNKISTLKEEGYDEIIVRDRHFKDNLKQLIGDRSLNLVLECIGGSIFKDSYELLAPTGRLVSYGSANFTPSSNRLNIINAGWKYIRRPMIDPLKMVSDNKSVMGFNLIWLWDQNEMLRNYMDELMNLSLSPQRVGNIFSWKDLRRGLQEFQSGNTIGKVVIEL